MSGPDEFDRLRDLLGDVCEGAATRPAPAEDDEGGRDEIPRRGTGPRRAAAGKTGPSDPSRAIAEVWPEVAGPDVAANATPVHLGRGRLVVSTSSSVWAHTLQYMTQDLVSGLNERLGERVVRQIVFRHAGWEERPRPDKAAGASGERRPAGAQGRLSAEQKEAIAEVEGLDLPPDIKERIARAMKAAFVRGEQGSVR